MSVYNEYMNKVIKNKGYLEMPFGDDSDRTTLKSKRASGFVDTENGKGLKYHNTVVVELFNNGNVRLNSGGWMTNTTKSRINQFAPNGIGVYQKNGKWFVTVPNGQVYDFGDGMVISPEGDLIDPGDAL